MMECVQVVADELSLLRCGNKFEKVLERCNLDASRLGLEPLSVPRIRKPPARFTGSAEAHSAVTVSDYCKPQFFELIDTATLGLAQRFTESVGLQTFSKLEGILLIRQVDEAQLQAYSEIDGTDCTAACYVSSKIRYPHSF